MEKLDLVRLSGGNEGGALAEAPSKEGTVFSVNGFGYRVTEFKDNENNPLAVFIGMSQENPRNLFVPEPEEQ
jgi:hypothetical protein